MKESSIIGGFQELAGKVNQIVKFVESLQQSIRLAFTGQEIRGNAIQKLLIKKGLVTEAEFTEMVGEVIKEMQEQAEQAAKDAAAKTNIITPTPEQTVAINNTPATAEVPVTPPAQA